MLSFLPSILLVQFFRRIQPRRAQRQLSPLRQAICQVKQQPMLEVTKKRPKGTFPWWCLFIAYGVSMLMAVVSIFFIIVRGIEFGDMKCQKWLTSLLSSFFSSVILIQPLKVSVDIPIWFTRHKWTFYLRLLDWRSSSPCSFARKAKTTTRRQPSSSMMILWRWTTMKSTYTRNRSVF